MNYIGVLLSLVIYSSSYGQIPVGYYDSAEGLEGEELRSELRDIIDGHDSQSYGSLWTHMQDTDKKANGKVWDMYSTRDDGSSDYEFTFVEDQCGNYSGEGSCYNREHSVPASWYNDASPTYTDLFHLYPTDGWTNGLRSNYPFGEVDNPSVTTTNGSKKGANTYPGYTGLVFEPIDEFKGDFARTYFYVSTRYMNNISSWNSAAFSGNNLSEWHRNMLLEWHWNDPVSQKEIDRNNAVHDIQDNRNPYIDHPEWVDLVWTSTSGIIGQHSSMEMYNIKNGRLTFLENPSYAEVLAVDGRIIASYSKGAKEEILLPKNQTLIVVIRGIHGVQTDKVFLLD